MYILVILYVVIGKGECSRCDILKTLLDGKGIRCHYLECHYLDMMEMPLKSMTYLKRYCSSHPMVLSVDYYMNYSYIVYLYDDCFLRAKKIEWEAMGGTGGCPPKF